jgi:hypothetical protein
MKDSYFEIFANLEPLSYDQCKLLHGFNTSTFVAVLFSLSISFFKLLYQNVLANMKNRDNFVFP